MGKRKKKEEKLTKANPEEAPEEKREWLCLFQGKITLAHTQS